ncbi:EF-hand domain-containing protein [Burkholderia sp. LMU1-1-1.1]|uniref:EF-hand domain-containing protein n=1 Tax=Burkholderia sp. LMU1-1-1.1 TaxID=3135266 RepID=UPI00343FAECC
MTTAISGVSGGAGAISFDPAKGAARLANKVFGDMDADKDGKVKKEEFVSGLESKGVSADDAAKQFDAIDKQKAGSITKTDLETAIKSGDFAPPRPAEGGAPAAQGGGKPQGAGGGGGASAASSAAKTYEAADTNEDGTVSQQEELVYSISHPSESASDPSKIGGNINEIA